MNGIINPIIEIIKELWIFIWSTPFTALCAILGIAGIAITLYTKNK